MPKSSFNGEILHCNAVRLRVVGEGDLKLTLHSLDKIESSDLFDVTMATTTSREPTQLANFSSQRICLELGTEEIDETFTISKITFFIKPIFSEYPR